jgi:hypothetical protein
MQQQPSSISELIRLLRHFGARPALYIQPVDVQNAQSFLGGVSFCVQVLTGPRTYEEMDAVVTSRGWRVSPGPRGEPLEPQMRERGMTDAQIIAELAEIEAVTLERRSEAAA